MEKLTALNIFRRVAELQSFSAAARELDLSNAAISKNVRELEAELGVRLINRTTRRLHLTEAGALYLTRTNAILDDLREADASVGELGAAPRGLIRVSAPMSLGIAKIAPAIADFLADYPEIRIELDLNDRYIDIVEGGFDIAIRGGARLDNSSLIARKLGDLDRVVCASPDYIGRHGAPRTPADLSDHACLAYTLSSAPHRWTFLRKGERQAIDISGPLRVNNSIAIAAAARAGLGVGLLPTFAVAQDLKEGALKQMLKSWSAEPAAIYAIYPSHREASIKLRLFIDALARAL